jgi:hypothetical protein
MTDEAQGRIDDDEGGPAVVLLPGHAAPRRGDFSTRIELCARRGS